MTMSYADGVSLGLSCYSSAVLVYKVCTLACIRVRYGGNRKLCCDSVKPMSSVIAESNQLLETLEFCLQVGWHFEMSMTMLPKFDKPVSGVCDFEFDADLKTAIKTKSLADAQKLLLEKLSLQQPAKVSTLKYPMHFAVPV